MKRRRFITLLGGAAAAWPLVAPAQQSPMPVVGFISSRSRDADAHLIAILHQRLKEAGYVEGHNMAFEYRWAEGQYDRLPALAGWWFAAARLEHLPRTSSTSSRLLQRNQR